MILDALHPFASFPAWLFHSGRAWREHGEIRQGSTIGGDVPSNGHLRLGRRTWQSSTAIRHTRPYLT